MSVGKNSPSSKACCFCNLTENNELEYGKFYEYNGIFTHYYCLLLSSNMEQNGEDHEGILGFLAEDIHKELRRGKRLICSYCKKLGATLGCYNARCKRVFHLPCGLKMGSLHQFFGEFKSFCTNHRPKQLIDSHILCQISSIENLLCYICYDKVNPNDHATTLWAPCCKKDAWFHRKCVQQLAMSAGYFFKCPLCNNKKDFQKVMQECGIFVPSQDASWELMPNAFEELLYRHDQCDATLCLCPQGRKYTSNNAKWELVLCRTCGSQGIHVACGELRWANRIWDCVECTSILNNAKDNENVRSNSSSCSSLRESDSDSDSDSDTDISIGTEFRVPYASRDFSLSCSSSSSSLSDTVPGIKLRPGPRSFKLQQQMKAQQINEQTLELTDLKKNKVDVIDAQDFDNSLSESDIVMKGSLTSKKNIPQERKEENNIQKNEHMILNERNNSPRERKFLINKVSNEKSHQKKIDIITIESDDENYDNLEIVLSKQETSQTSLQRSDRSLDTTDNIVSSKDSNVTLNGFSGPANKNAFTTLAQDDSAALPRESVPNPLSSDSSSETTNVTDVGNSSVMNIKITNVTSLPPEMFESAQDMIRKDVPLKNSDNNFVSSMTKGIFEAFRSILPLKRGMHGESSSVEDRSCKKIKRDDLCKNYKIESCTKSYVTLALDKNTRQCKATSIESDKIHKNAKNPPKCVQGTSTSTYRTFDFPLSSSEKKDLSKQFASFKTYEIPDSSLNDTKTNNQFPPSLKTYRHSRHTNQIRSRYSKHENGTTCKAQSSQVSSMRKTTDTQHLRNSELPPVNVNPTSGLNSTNRQNRKSNEAIALYAIPSRSITLPRRRNKTSMTNNNKVTTYMNQYITFLQKIEQTNEPKIITSVQKPLIAKVCSPGQESPNKIYCDGDAGTSRAEIRSTNERRKPNEHNGSVQGAEIGLQRPAATRSVFLQVTNNHNNCHQPRLIPQYMNLNDLKFRTCGSDSVQMILYDTFSVNISTKNSKESKKRSTSLTSPKECALISCMRDEASSNIECIAEQRSIDKLHRSFKNENYLANDKIKCTTRSHDDAKENLDPVKSNTLSRNDIFNNSLMNDTNDIMTPSDHVCENDDETQLISTDTDLSTFNRKICNTNVDSTTDDVKFMRNGCNPSSPVNFEDIQQISVSNVMVESREEKIDDDRPFRKEIDKVESSSVNPDLNIVTNKSVGNVLQNTISLFMNKYIGNDRKIRHDYVDGSSMLWNNKCFSSTDITRPKAQNRSISRVAKYNEHDILNKQINTCDTERFIQYTTSHRNIGNHNSENNTKHNAEPCFKVCIDLCKIPNIDTKPELLINRKEHDDDN